MILPCRKLTRFHTSPLHQNDQQLHKAAQLFGSQHSSSFQLTKLFDQPYCFFRGSYPPLNIYLLHHFRSEKYSAYRTEAFLAKGPLKKKNPFKTCAPAKRFSHLNQPAMAAEGIFCPPPNKKHLSYEKTPPTFH